VIIFYQFHKILSVQHVSFWIHTSLTRRYLVLRQRDYVFSSLAFAELNHLIFILLLWFCLRLRMVFGNT